MVEEEYQTLLEKLRKDWGGMTVYPNQAGVIRAKNDSTTGLLVGQRAAIIAEIINRALGGRYDQR